MSTNPPRGLLHDEAPIFEQGAPGRSGASLGELDVPVVDPDRIWPEALKRKKPPALPEVSEPEVVRHYTRLSHWNYSIDTGMYPLGSCTMKHNPKAAERIAQLAPFAQAHPYAPESQIQGTLAVIHHLEQALANIAGFAEVTSQPAAGAQGELCGLMMMRAYHEANKGGRSEVLIPDSAHGTNPASCALNGFDTVELPTNENGQLPLDTVKAAVSRSSGKLAGIMITNPNTLGLFEAQLGEITALIHEAGGLVYMDGANLNALLGRFRPGDHGVDCMHFNLHKTFATPHGGGGPGAGPVGVSPALVPYLPVPRIRNTDENFSLDYDCPESIGRLRSFAGNFGVLLRAYAYIREYGGPGLKRVTEMAVLNANYLRAAIEELLEVPYPGRCMHEVIASDKTLKPFGITTLEVAKRLIDYGFHPPTVYFPLIVAGSLMIEPTETEPRSELDRFLRALKSVIREAQEDPELLKSAPHFTGIRRLDEAKAARKPKLRWSPPESC